MVTGWMSRAPAAMAGACLALTISACASAGSSSAPEPSGPLGGEPRADASAGGAVASWAPTVRIPVRHYSDEEAADIRLSYLRRNAAAFLDDAQVEQVLATPLERWVGADEQDRVVQACVGDQGFEVEIGSGGGLQWEGLPDSQRDAFFLAFWICHARFTEEPKYMVDLTADQYGVLYDYWTQFYVPCLAATAGLDAPEPPSRDVFVAQILDESTRDGAWTPMPDAAQFDTAEAYDAFTAACPQMPPAGDLYG